MFGLIEKLRFVCCRGAPVVQQSMGAKPRRRTNAELDELQHPLLGDQPTLQLMAPKDATGESTPPHPPAGLPQVI